MKWWVEFVAAVAVVVGFAIPAIHRLGGGAAPGDSGTAVGATDPAVEQGSTRQIARACRDIDSTLVPDRSSANPIAVKFFVRHPGDLGWTTSTSAHPGEELQFLVVLRTRERAVPGVVLSVTLPEMSVVTGSGIYRSRSIRQPVQIAGDSVATGGLGLGVMRTDSQAFYCFAARVRSNALTWRNENEADVSANGTLLIWDSVVVGHS